MTRPFLRRRIADSYLPIYIPAMGHAKPSDLEDVQILLSQLRTLTHLKEKSTGCFYFKSKGVLHFHVTKDRRFVHVFDGSDWQEVDLLRAPSQKVQLGYFKTLQGFLRDSSPTKSK